MGDFFGGLRSGIQFPQVVMNQGPLPGAGGLPQPLHESADARINYGSSLLGDLTPYAYGEPGYLSSQNAYLNIPHKIQKIVPVVYLPVAKNGATDFFDLPHPIDDGDIAFVLRLDRGSLFCTGLKNADMRRAGLGTAVDPLINLCTVNYILSGLQLGLEERVQDGNLWAELFYNLDKQRFGKPEGPAGRNYMTNPVTLGDVIHVIRHCIRPFGVVRGSEKQGGQDEATISPATWPVSFVASLTIDGKESNVMNIWHYHELHAGNDLVLRLKLMPVRTYTLNHYYKGVKRQNWGMPERYVWQLVPDLFHLDGPKDEEVERVRAIISVLPKPNPLDSAPLIRTMASPSPSSLDGFPAGILMSADFPWQNLGYWHIGRSQLMTGKYGTDEYWHNDLANSLKTNHLDITFQPVFETIPSVLALVRRSDPRFRDYLPVRLSDKPKPAAWTPALGLEQLVERNVRPRLQEEAPVVLGIAPPPDPAPVVEEEIPQPEVTSKKAGKGGRRGKAIGGSLIKSDGTQEESVVGLL